MESRIYILGAMVFGAASAFLSPSLHWALVGLIALVYFGLLRLLASWVAARSAKRAQEHDGRE